MNMFGQLLSLHCDPCLEVLQHDLVHDGACTYMWYMIHNKLDEDPNGRVGVMCCLQGFHVSRVDVMGYRSASIDRRDVHQWEDKVRKDHRGCDVVCITRYRYVPTSTFTYARFPSCMLDSHMLDTVMSIVTSFYDTINIAAATYIQKIFRGYRVRKKFSKSRMLLLNELLVLPPVQSTPISQEERCTRMPEIHIMRPAVK